MNKTRIVVRLVLIAIVVVFMLYSFVRQNGNMLTLLGGIVAIGWISIGILRELVF